MIAGTTTDALAEGSTNKYYTDTRRTAALSSTATGLSYNNSTGVLSLGAGYVIPLTASTTDWNTAYLNRITSATAPLSLSNNVLSLSQSSASTDGYLSSTDWNSFNSRISTTTLGLFDKGYFFSTTSASYFLSQNQGNSYSTTSANYWLTTKSTTNLAEGSNLYYTAARVAGVIAGTTTDALAEGSTRLYFTNARADARINATSTIGTLTSAPNLGTLATSLTGILKATSGVLSSAIAGTDYENPLTFTYPLTRTTNTVSLAFGTTTANTWSALQTFSGGINVGGSTFTSLLGTGLINSGGSLAVSTSSFSGSGSNFNADLLDGLDSTYFTANGFSTTSASYFLSQNQGAAYSTTSANYWLTTKSTTNLAEGSNLYYTASRVASVIAGTTTDALAEGSTNKYYTDTRARAALSTTATGLSYNNSTGVLSLGAGYVIPLTASTTDWNTAYLNRITSATAPLLLSNNVLSLSQSTASTDGYLSSVDWNSFNSRLSTTTLGLFDKGYFFSTTSANYYIAQNQGNTYSTTSANYWLTTKTTDNLAEGSTNLYWTNNRFDTRLSATTTLPNITTLANLSTVKTSLSGLLKASSGVLSSAVAGTDYAAPTTGSSILYGNGAGGFSNVTVGSGLTFTGGTLATNGAGITSIGPTGQQQTGGTQTLATTTSSFNGLTVGLTITASANTQTFQPTLSGTLAAGGGGTGINNPSAAGILVGSYAGGSWQQVATSSLGLLTTNVAEGTNLYFTNSRAQAAISVSGVPLTYSAGVIGINQASGSQAGYLSAADYTAFNNKISSTSLSAAYPLQYNSGTGVFSIAYGTTTANTWSALQTFNGGITTSGTVTLGSLTGILRAASGVVSTGTVNLASEVTGTLPVANGGTGSTTLTGLLKGNGTSGIQSAVAGTDYAPATIGSNLLYGNGAGGFSQASVSSPLTFSAGALGIQVANGSQNGYLSSTDFNTFNGKQAALTFTYPLVNTSNTVSLAFGTTTANTWSSLQTFSSGINVGGSTFTSLLGTGLINSGGSLAVSTSSFSGSGSNFNADLLDGLDSTYFTANSFSTTSAAYFLSQNQGTAYSTTSANYWLTTKSTTNLAEGSNLYYTAARVAGVIAGTTTDALAEGSTRLYFTNARADARINATSTIGTLTSAPNLGTLATSLTGILKATSGVLSAAISGTDYQAPLAFTYPLVNTSNTVSLAFGTTTANSWSALQTFGAGINVGGSTFTSLLGTGLVNSAGSLAISTSSFSGSGSNFNADLLDGLDSTYFTANAYSTTSANYWLTTKSTTNLAEGSNLYYTAARVAGVIAGTTTDALAEGATNKYFTNARADARINATSTIGTLTSAPNLGTLATSLTGILKATSGVLSTAVSGTDYQAPLTFTYPLVNTSNTISLAFGTTTANSWSALQTFNGGITTSGTVTLGSLTGILRASSGVVSTGNINLASEVTGTLPVANGGTGSTTLTGILKGNGTGGVQTAVSGTDYQAPGSYITALTGDVTATGPGSAAATLATVNSNVGSFGGSTAIPTFTVNAKGLITAAGSVAVIAPAGTLTGATLASNVLASSLTSVGTLSALTVSGNTSLTAATTTSLFSGTLTSNTFAVGQTGSTTVSSTGALTTPSLTIGSLSGVLKASSGVVSAAVSGTDYAPATVGSNLLYGNGAGGFSQATVSSPLTFSAGALGIQVANGSQNGYLSSTDWNTFNNKQTALTFAYPLVNTSNTVSLAFGTTTANSWSALQTFNGGITTSGTVTLGSLSGILRAASGVVSTGNINLASEVTGTLPVANGGTGSTTLTGLLKGNGTGGILTAVAGTDYQAPGSYITALTGDVTASGPGSAAATLATVNSNVGSFGGSTAIPTFTVNAKGLITAAGSVAVIAPAGTLTGATLANNVLASSLTSVGTLSALTVSGNTNLGAATTTTLFSTNHLSNTFAAGQTGTTTISSTGALTTPSLTIGSLSGLLYAASGAVSNATVNSPLTFSAGALSINNAAADGSTKGAATFLAADFNDNGSGLVSLDYANGQKATGSVPGFLASSDFTTFNGKQAVLTFTYPLVNTANTISLAFGTTTANSWSSLQTFNGGITTSGTVTLGALNGILRASSGVVSTGNINLASEVTGTLPVANGGTGSTTLTGLLKGNGTGGVLSAVAGTDYQAPGSYITALTGDVTATGPGSAAATLATVNSNVGSFGGSTAIPTFTVNAKGLITAAGSVAVIAPAGTLTGATLASNVLASSLTSVGTLSALTVSGNTVLGAATTTSLYSTSQFANIFAAGQTGTTTISSTGALTTPSLTIGSLSGLLKGTGGVVSAAVSGTDYAPATSGSNLLYGNGSGGFSSATISSPLTFSGGALGIQVANGSQNGYLTSSDFNTFNGKQAALTFSYPLLNTSNTISLAFGTTTANTWSNLQTFTSGFISNASSTVAAALNVGGTGYFAGNLGIGTSTPFAKLALAGGNFLQSVTTPVSVVSSISLPSTTNNIGVAVQGHYAYVIDSGSSFKLSVIDITVPAAPVVVGTVADVSNLAGAFTIRVAGQYAYIASTGSNKFVVVDISNPSSPTIVAALSNSVFTGARGLYLSGHYAYTVSSAGTGTFTVVDISVPTSPVITGTLTSAGTLDYMDSVYVSGTYAYVTSLTNNSLSVINISNPSNPVITGTYSSVGNLGNPKDVVVAGRYAYALGQATNSLAIIDVSVPSTPTLTGVLVDNTNFNNPKNIVVAGRYAYLTSNTGNRFTVVDISNPAAPVVVSSLLDATNLNNPRSIAIVGKYAYVSTGSKFTVLDITGIDVPSANLGVANTESLSVYENGDIGNDLYVRNGLIVGSGGAQIGGSLSVSGTAGVNPFNIASSSGASLLALSQAGNLGIGTSSPYAKLSLGGGNLVIGAATAGGTNGNLFLNGLATPAGSFLAVNAFGQVIATTTPSGGGASFSGTIGQVEYFTGTNTAIGTSSLMINTNGNVGIDDSSADFNFEISGSSQNGYFGVTNSVDGDIFNINTAGNVGIGTTSPYAALALGGGNLVIGAATAGGTPGDLFLPKLGTAAGTFLAVNAFGQVIATTTPSGGGASFSGTIGQVEYFTGTNTAIGTSSLIINTNGYVGIGTTTPTGLLSLAGGNNLGFVLDTGNAGFSNSTLTIVGPQINVTKTTDGSAKALILQANGSTVGIGQTNPTALLHITGTAPVAGATGTGATDALKVQGATGGANNATSGTAFGGAGSSISLVAGGGGAITGTPATGFGGTGGNLTLTAGAGGIGGGTSAFAGAAGNVNINGGLAASASGAAAGDVIIAGGGATVGGTIGGNVYLAGGSGTANPIGAGNVILGVPSSIGNPRGLVGIGTSSPWALLSIDPEATNMPAGAPEFVIGSSTTTHLIVTNQGKLGIGTTSPAFRVNIADANAAQLSLSDGSLTSNLWTFRSAGNNLYVGTSSPSTYATSTIPTLTLFNAGQAGLIGIGSSTPWGKLSVELGPTTPGFVVSNQGSSTPSFLVTGANQNGIVAIGTSTPSINHNFVVAGNSYFVGSTTLQTSLNAGFVVGPSATTPTLTVNSGTASGVTGLSITNAATGGTTALATTDSGANSSLTINAKGTGTIGLGTVSTGAIAIGNVNSGNITLNTATANSLLFQTNSSSRLSLTSYVAAFSPAAMTSGTAAHFTFTNPSGDTSITASTEATDVLFNMAQIRTHLAGPLTLQRDFRIQPSTHAFASASTLTTAATLAIDAPPVGGTNATISTSTALLIGGTNVASALTTNAYGLMVFAPTGATNNYAASFVTGNVGVGTTSPWRSLAVTGTFGLDGATSSNTGNFLCLNTTTKEVTQGTTCTLSTQKVKNTIQTLASSAGLDDITRLNPVTYLYDQGFGDNGSSTQIGFIAEQASAVNHIFGNYATQAFNTPNGMVNVGDPNGINWNAITAASVLAIKQLASTTNQIAISNTSLTAQVSSLAASSTAAHALTATTLTANNVHVSGGLSSDSVMAQSITSAGNVFAANVIVSAYGSVPSEALTAGGVDLYKFATYNYTAVQQLGARADLATTRLDALEVRVGALEAQASANASSTAAALSASSLEGLDIVQGGDATTVLDFLMGHKETLATTTNATVFTGRLAAGLDVVSPTGTFNGLTVNSLGSVGGTMNVLSDTTFIGRPYLNSDTAGFAVIHDGQRTVQVTFDRPYLAIPVVTASVAIDDQQGTSAEDEADAYFSRDIQYVVVAKSVNGFTIVMNKAATDDVTFNWMAFAVKNPKLFESSVQQPPEQSDATSTPPTDGTSTPSDTGTGADGGTPPAGDGTGSGTGTGTPDTGTTPPPSTPDPTPPPTDTPAAGTGDNAPPAP